MAVINHDNNIVTIRNEFFQLQDLLVKKLILKDDVISMGNLALFVDFSFNRYKWLEKKKQIHQFANQGDKNEVNMLIAHELYSIANRLEISDNLVFKLNKMTTAYKVNKLMYFDIVLDPYEFPDWFKRIMPFLPAPTRQEVHKQLLKQLNHYHSLKEKGNQATLAYFIDKMFAEEKPIHILSDFVDKVYNESENNVSWFVANYVFRCYYPEMEKKNLKHEQTYALQKLKEYKVLYEQKRLTCFDLLTDSMKEKILIDFFRST